MVKKTIPIKTLQQIKQFLRDGDIMEQEMARAAAHIVYKSASDTYKINTMHGTDVIRMYFIRDQRAFSQPNPNITITTWAELTTRNPVEEYLDTNKTLLKQAQNAITFTGNQIDLNRVTTWRHTYLDQQGGQHRNPVLGDAGYTGLVRQTGSTYVSQGKTLLDQEHEIDFILARLSGYHIQPGKGRSVVFIQGRDILISTFLASLGKCYTEFHKILTSHLGSC